MYLKQLAAVVAAAVGSSIAISSDLTPYAPMMQGKNIGDQVEWQVKPLFTVGETINDYTPPGILDGIGVFGGIDHGHVRVLVNHELGATVGYPYKLANGAELLGSRISFFDIQKSSQRVLRAGLAFNTIYDHNGLEVLSSSQLQHGGLARLCSARSIHKGELGFADDVYMTGEEEDNGLVWALDIKSDSLWAAPALGRGAWENVTPLQSPSAEKVALLLSDDTAGAPLYLYLGEKNARGDDSFLDRNGLAHGTLYCWKADNGDTDPQDFNGFMQSRDGTFVELPGGASFDDTGLRALATGQMGCFAFSRPEDVHENPANPTQVAFASTGRGQLYPADNWGTLYRVDTRLADMTAKLTILHDADDSNAIADPSASGIRSPDNLTWSADGWIYVQEDKSTSPGSLFGASGREASIWAINPSDGAYFGNYMRIAEMDRSAVAPEGTTDPSPNDIGNWESSGILDVSEWLQTDDGETLLIGTVQAHSISNGIVGGEGLVQGGQLFLLSNRYIKPGKGPKK